MRKAQVIKHLPQIKQYLKDIKAKEKEIAKLETEVDELIDITAELEGVTLHNDFPVALDEFPGDDVSSPSVEIHPGCDDTVRYALASRNSSSGETPERWWATGYREPGTSEAKVLIEGVTRQAAVRAGKDYVATGKVGRPATEPTTEPKKRGRPPKVKPVA